MSQASVRSTTASNDPLPIPPTVGLASGAPLTVSRGGPEASDETGRTPDSPPPACVLVVDDDQAFRSVLRRALERTGYRTLLAGDGRAAWGQLQTHQVDLVLTDLIMPDVEGVELILRIRREYPHLPVIAMSGGGRVEPACYLTGARYCGAHATFAKPFSIAELLETVRALLQRKP